MMFIQVDLPLPDWPMMDKNSPGYTLEGNAVYGVYLGIAHFIDFIYVSKFVKGSIV